MFDLDRWEEIWQTINRNRKRSIMTAFGVFWGIFMLTIMMGAGLGLKRLMYSSFGSMAVNSCFYWGGQTSLPYKGLPSGRRWSLENEDMAAIKTQVPGVKNVAGIIWGSTYKFSRKKVCVITEQVWEELFPNRENPVGQTIRMNNMYLTVVGVCIPPRNGVQFQGPTSVLIPFSTLQKMYNKGNKFDGMAVAAYDNWDIKEVEENVKKVFQARHTLSPDDNKAVQGFNLGDLYNKFSGLFSGISILTWIVGTGTLLAGIVGVSNIMLVTVRERTQEIGIRRALGAKPRTIISQIMSESFVLTFVSGIFGLALAIGILSLAETLLSSLTATPKGGGLQINTQISFGLALGSTGILILGSLLAGILPANRALRDESGAVYDIVCGTFFLCGAPSDSESFSGLTTEQVTELGHSLVEQMSYVLKQLDRL